jgi:hypothetical protein
MSLPGDKKNQPSPIPSVAIMLEASISFISTL